MRKSWKDSCQQEQNWGLENIKKLTYFSLYQSTKSRHFSIHGVLCVQHVNKPQHSNITWWLWLLCVCDPILELSNINRPSFCSHNIYNIWPRCSLVRLFCYSFLISFWHASPLLIILGWDRVLVTTTIVRVMFSLANVYFLTVSSSVKVRVSDIEEVHPLEIPGSTGKKKAYCVFYGRLTGVFLSWCILSSDSLFS